MFDEAVPDAPDLPAVLDAVWPKLWMSFPLLFYASLEETWNVDAIFTCQTC